MNWGPVGQLIGKAAPILGTLLGGPVGGAAGSLIADVLGVEETPEAIEAEIRANPEALVKLKQAQLTHKKEIAELAFKEKELTAKTDLEHRKITIEDRGDARGRDLQLKQAGHTNYRADIMIVVAFVAFCFICYLINTTEIKAGVLAIYNMAIGSLLKMLGDAFSFEFGSSRGSKEKDNSMNQLKSLISSVRGK